MWFDDLDCQFNKKAFPDFFYQERLSCVFVCNSYVELSAITILTGSHRTSWRGRSGASPCLL